MKTAIFLLSILLSAHNTQAQSFRAYKPVVGQGDVLVFNIDGRWRAPGTANSAVSIFGEHYLPNDKGDVFVGVGVDKLGKYNATLVEYGRGVRLSSDVVEIEVVKTDFLKTRTAGYSRFSFPRTGPEMNAIYQAFSLGGKTTEDLTDGNYIEPLNGHQGIIDIFGLIYRNNPTKLHNGADLRIPVRTPVRAANQGVVVLAAHRFSKEGNMVILYHGRGIFSVYMHLFRIDVKKDQKVSKGDVIGLSGATGAGVREPHLHFSIKINKSYIDPLKFIDTINSYLK